jgi:hypothetical protein
MHRAQTIRVRAKHAISARLFCSIYTSQRLYGTYTKFIGFTKILGKLNKLDKLVLWIVETTLMRRGPACNPRNWLDATDQGNDAATS